MANDNDMDDCTNGVGDPAACPKFNKNSPKTRSVKAAKTTKTKLPKVKASLNMNVRDLNADPGDINYQGGSSGSGTGDKDSYRTDVAPGQEIQMAKKRKIFGR